MLLLDSSIAGNTVERFASRETEKFRFLGG